jgi:hypothetical protein
MFVEGACACMFVGGACVQRCRGLLLYMFVHTVSQLACLQDGLHQSVEASMFAAHALQRRAGFLCMLSGLTSGRTGV